MVSIGTFERPSLELLHEGKYMVHWTPCDSNRLQDYPDEAQTSVEVEGCAYHLQLATDKENIRFELLVRKIGVGNGDKHPSLKARIFFAQSTEMLGMNETSAGTWGPIQLNIPSFPSVVKKLSLKYVIQVVVNFNWFMTTGQCRLLEHLSNLFENPLFSDVCFNINGVELKAHSALLAEASPMFSTILAGNIQENETAIYVTDIEPSIFKEILRYIYTGKAEGLECSGVAEALLIAADKYQIKSLKHICETTLCSNLKSNNVINCLILADIHHASQLKEAAVAFIVKEKAVISEQNDWHKLSKNYPELFFRTIQEMFKLM